MFCQSIEAEQLVNMMCIGQLKPDIGRMTDILHIVFTIGFPISYLVASVAAFPF